MWGGLPSAPQHLCSYPGANSTQAPNKSCIPNSFNQFCYLSVLALHVFCLCNPSTNSALTSGLLFAPLNSPTYPSFASVSVLAAPIHCHVSGGGGGGAGQFKRFSSLSPFSGQVFQWGRGASPFFKREEGDKLSRAPGPVCSPSVPCRLPSTQSGRESNQSGWVSLKQH